MDKTPSSVMDDVQQQVQNRLSVKYNWKRVPYRSIDELQKRIARALFPRPPVKRCSKNQELDLGTDDAGRDVVSGLEEYQRLLLSRNVRLHTLIALGSRAKGRGKPESDIDVTIIASDLPGKSSPGFPNIPKKILNIRRWFLLNDIPIFMGIQPSGCCSKEEFLSWLGEFKLQALDAVYYGKVIYDDGFWQHVLATFREMEDKYQLNKTNLKELLIAL